MPEDASFDEVSFLRQEVRRLRSALNALTPRLDLLLRRRGFRIYKKEPSEHLLIPGPEFIDDYYRTLHKYSFRLFLRDVIKHQDLFTVEKVTRYATAGVTGQYVEFLSTAGMAQRRAGGYALARRPVKSFGETLEWYMAEVFRREFGTEAAWGVKFRRPGVGGDYDVIAKFDGSLLYMEVKSSPPRQIYDPEISAFLDRVEDLSPEISVFFMDTELRMKDKIVPMFEDALRRRHAEPPPVVRMVKELFQIGDRIFIINAKDSVLGNIETVLSRYFRR